MRYALCNMHPISPRPMVVPVIKVMQYENYALLRYALGTSTVLAILASESEVSLMKYNIGSIPSRRFGPSNSP